MDDILCSVQEKISPVSKRDSILELYMVYVIKTTELNVQLELR